MKRIILPLLFVLGTTVWADSLELYPTFENCSFYFTTSSAYSFSQSWATDSVIRILYKPVGDAEWNTAYRPVYDSSKQQFRGSLFHLIEDTDYEVRVEMNEGGGWAIASSGTFRTWTDNPPLKSTLKLSLLGAYKQGQPLVLNAMRGSETGWIKVIGNVPVNAGNVADNAVNITNCEYLILEGFTVTGGRINGINIDESCRNIRIIGADISEWGRVPVDQVYLADATNYPSSKYKNYDATFLDDRGELIRNDAGIAIVTSSNDESRTRFNFVVERCYIHDQNGYANPWYGTRIFGTGAGVDYRFLHPQGAHGMYVRSAGSVVVRYNDITGSDIHRLHDACGGMDNGKPLGGWYRDTDIYGNYLGFGQDDGIELDGSQMNVRFYDNRIEQFRCGVSAAPCLAGPSYVNTNVVADLGDSERDNGAAMKNGGGDTYSKGLIHYISNTIYVAASCIASVGYGSDSNQGMFQGFSRNNILYCTVKSSSYGGNSVHETATHPNCSYDYDLLTNSKMSGREGVANVLAPNSETHAVKGDPRFTDLEHRVFTLTDQSIGIGTGQYLPGISVKQRPDIGAFQKEESSLYPRRPIDVTSDKYQVRINPQGNASFTISTGDVEDGLEYWVSMDKEVQHWLSTTTVRSPLLGNSTYLIRLRASVPAEMTRLPKGVLFVRFSNGLSIPVSLVADNAEPVGSDALQDIENYSDLCIANGYLRVVTEGASKVSVSDILGNLMINSAVPTGESYIGLQSLNKGTYIAVVGNKRIKFILQ